MNDFDLENKATELKKELMKLNSQIAIGTIPKKPSKVKELKRTIAKILTIKHEKLEALRLQKNRKEETKRNE